MAADESKKHPNSKRATRKKGQPKGAKEEKCGVPDGDRARDRWVQKTGKPPEEASLVVERAQLWSDLRGRLVGEGPGRTMKGKIKSVVLAESGDGEEGFPRPAGVSQ